MPFQSMNNTLIKDIAAYSVIVIAVVFLVLTIRPGHGWGGDFALYIMHAINILSGQPYTDTGYVYNPNIGFLSPRSYPPVFPLFLVPVYQFFGLDLYAIKIASILVFAVFLLLFYCYVSNKLDSPVAQVLVVAACAFSPWYWVAKDRIQPDFVFMFFVYAAILIMDRVNVPDKLGWRRVLLAITAGFMAYLAYGTRSLGLALIPALIMSDVIRHRVISRTTVIAAAVFIVLYFTQNLILETDQAYLDTYKHWWGASLVQNNGADVVETSFIDIGRFVSVSLATGKRHADFYHNKMLSYWDNGINVRLQDVVYVVMGVLAVIGFFGLAIRRPSTGEYVLVVYAAILLVVPYMQDRYLLPLIPLYLLYIFRGAEILFARGIFSVTRGPLLNGVTPVLIVSVVLLSYLGSYSTRNFGGITKGVETKESVELFEYLRTATPGDSLIVFRKPRPLALYTGRHSVRYHSGVNQQDLWDYLVMIGATHVVAANDREIISEDPRYMEWVERNSSKLGLVYKNRNFRVYRMNN